MDTWFHLRHRNVETYCDCKRKIINLKPLVVIYGLSTTIGNSVFIKESEINGAEISICISHIRKELYLTALLASRYRDHNGAGNKFIGTGREVGILWRCTRAFLLYEGTYPKF